jgi:Cation transport ATPase
MDIPYLLNLSQKTMFTIKLNLALSMLLNFVAIILAMTGILNPIVGALVHNVGSVAVIINSATLLKFKSK